jgi:hypothetical protein
MVLKVMPDRRPDRAKPRTQKSIEFTVVDGKRRQNCMLKTTYFSTAHAMTYLKSHRSKIEKAAKQKWADGLIDGGVVYVEMV